MSDLSQEIKSLRKELQEQNRKIISLEKKQKNILKNLNEFFKKIKNLSSFVLR